MVARGLATIQAIINTGVTVNDDGTASKWVNRIPNNLNPYYCDENGSMLGAPDAPPFPDPTVECEPPIDTPACPPITTQIPMASLFPWDPECVLDFFCAAACRLTFVGCVTAAHNDYCTAISDAVDQYNTALDTACNTYNAAYNTRKEEYDTCIQDANTQFYNCMQNCPPGDPLVCLNTRNAEYESCMAGVGITLATYAGDYYLSIYNAGESYRTQVKAALDIYNAAILACRTSYFNCITACMNCP